MQTWPISQRLKGLDRWYRGRSGSICGTEGDPIVVDSNDGQSNFGRGAWSDHAFDRYALASTARPRFGGYGVWVAEYRGTEEYRRCTAGLPSSCITPWLSARYKSLKKAERDDYDARFQQRLDEWQIAAAGSSTQGRGADDLEADSTAV